MAIALPLLTVLIEERAAGPDLTRYLLVCGGLLGAILGLAYLFKRFLAGTVQRRAAKRSLRVVDVLPLGGKQKLVVVRCYDRSFLLGVGEKELSSIAELDVEELASAGDAAEATEPAQPFHDALADAVADENAPELVIPEPPASWNEGQGVLA
jgi:flagellar biosynthetic protein FliO